MAGTLKVDEVRMLARKAKDDSEFRASLVADPKSTVESVLGLQLPAEIQIRVLQETDTTWIIPAPVIGDLPKPENDREVIENAIFRVLADPSVRAKAKADPVVILNLLANEMPDDIGFFVAPSDEVQFLSEDDQVETIVLDAPERKFRMNADELDERMLDLVSAGGKHPCNTDDSRFFAQDQQRSTDSGVNNNVG